MSIRTFRKILKPVIWVIVAGLVLSGAMYMFSSFNFEPSGNYAFKMDGVKVSQVEIERVKNAITNSFSEQYKITIEPKTAELIAVDETINKTLALVLAKKLKVKVSNAEVEANFKAVKDQLGDKFNDVLTGQGFTKASLKREIANQLLVKAVTDKLQAPPEVTEAEIKEYFEKSADSKTGVQLKDVKDMIIADIQKEKVEKTGKDNYTLTMAKAREEMKFTSVKKEYEEFLPKVEIEQDGFKVTNVEVARRAIMIMAQTQAPEAEARKIAKSQFEDQIFVINFAKSKGVEVKESLPFDELFKAYEHDLVEKTKSEVKVTDAGLKATFLDMKNKFDKPETVEAYIAEVPFTLSDTDKSESKKVAEDLIKTLTPENFAENAKKLSKDPGSAMNGGDLGWFGKGMMVPAFEDAAFKGEVGKIYPQVVTTEFGNHILFIKEKKDVDGKPQINAAHILLPVEISQATKDIAIKKAEEVAAKIKSGDYTFENLSEKDKTISLSRGFNGITPSSVPGLQGSQELATKLFKSAQDEVMVETLKDGAYIVKKTKTVPAYKATLDDEDVKTQVTDTYTRTEAIKIISKELQAKRAAKK